MLQGLWTGPQHLDVLDSVLLRVGTVPIKYCHTGQFHSLDVQYFQIRLPSLNTKICKTVHAFRLMDFMGTANNSREKRYLLDRSDYLTLQTIIF